MICMTYISTTEANHLEQSFRLTVTGELNWWAHVVNIVGETGGVSLVSVEHLLRFRRWLWLSFNMRLSKYNAVDDLS